MTKSEFPLTESHIELIKLLKVLGIAETGGHAKMIVDSGFVIRNGEVETRKRAKLIKGDVIKLGEQISEQGLEISIV